MIDDWAKAGPGYWMHETSGALHEVVERYLLGLSLTPEDVAYLRAYFRQWIMAPIWDANPHATDESRSHLTRLRREVDELKNRETIDLWLDAAGDEGIDPL